jgi:hypothetical protein
MPGFAAILLYLLTATVAAQAQSSAVPGPSTVLQVKNIHIPKIARKPLLQEFLNGNSRGDMKRVDDFRQRDPGDGDPVSRKTSAWIGYDDKNLYVFFVCESPAGRTRARLAKREDIFSDDVVAVYLDTYHDRQRSYGFFVNPFGIQADAIMSEGQDDDFNFDTIWYSEGRLTPEGFAVSFTIPFNSLRFSAAPIQTWGLGLGRLIPDRSESSYWPFITEKIQGFHQQLGTMTGLENISPGRNIRITPYGAFGQSHFLDNPPGGVPAFRSQTTPRAGLDAKAVIHDSLTLDVALNPDFSQVESDDPQVTVNQRYEVQFPEKRPFFLENNGYFVTPENLFFSRRIVDPEYGARLTGKIGLWDIGVLGIDDRAAGAAVDTGEHAVIGVARVQREFGEQSGIGLLATSREFAGSSNLVAAIDTHLKLDANWTFSGQAITSETRAPGGVHSGGDAFNFDLRAQNRGWNYDLQYIDRSEGFHTDLGFIQRVNIRQAQQTIGRRFRPKSKVILTWGPQLYTAGDFDHRNVQQDWTVRPQLNIEMVGTTTLAAYHEETFERYQSINFRRNDTGFGGHTEYFKRATLDIGYAKGTRINYDVVSGLPAFLGNGSEFQTTITLRPISRLKLDEIYDLTRLYTADQPLTGQRPQAVFINHLARSRVNYQFTRELSLRLILDYNGVLQNPALINLERQKRISADVLMTYLIHPGTAFYIGYTDRLENLALFPGEPPAVGRIGFPSTTTGRQFFAKISYQFQF